MSENPTNPEQEAFKASKTDPSPLLLGLLLTAGLVLALIVFWVIFGAPSDKRPAAAQVSGDGSQLSRNELTVIAADDDESEDEEHSNAQTGKQKPGQKTPSNSATERYDLDKVGGKELTNGSREHSRGAGNRD